MSLATQTPKLKLPPGAVLENAASPAPSDLKLPPGATLETAPPVAQPQPSVLSRLGSNALSGFGVTSNEGAKNFFRHPLDTVIKSLEAQGELAKKARDSYNNGDYTGALQHALNYMVPFLGQQTDQAGTQLKEGDIAGGIGRTLGVGANIVTGDAVFNPQSVIPDAATDAASAVNNAVTPTKVTAPVRAVVRGINKGLQKAPGTIGGMVGGAIGAKLGGTVGAEIGGTAGAFAGREILPQVRLPGEGFGFPSRVTGGPELAPPYESVTGPENTPPTAASPAPAPAPASPQPTIPQRMTLAPAAARVAAPVSGEGALRTVLNNESHENLMQLAKDRGVDVSHETQLTPNVAKKGLIDKIVDDYSDDELDNFRDAYSYGGVEGTPMRMSTVPSRTAAAAPADDLTDVLQKSLEMVRAKKTGVSQGVYDKLFNDALAEGPAWTPEKAQPILSKLNNNPGVEFEARGSVGEGRSTSNDLDLWQKKGNLSDAADTLNGLGFKRVAKTGHGETWTNGAQHIDLWDSEHEPIKDFSGVKIPIVVRK